MKRILVTGSRDWRDDTAVRLALTIHCVCEDEITIVHGHCPTGVDAIADRFAVKHPRCTPERHPANWEAPCGPQCHHRPRSKNGKPYCPIQGHIRNQEMVDLGADVCLAFPLGESRGTRDCMKRAERAGIHVINYGDEVK
ncbi:hypothetical protein SEA_APPLETREE2_84 [Mycobacterium phage Appletree2]|nr:hypothetical protein SEA_APPLETREE2_84 [Mycobacterium phage Appletree2]